MIETMIIAHRGGKALGAENTISTMKKGLAAGAHAIELDVHCTFQGEPIVIHDATLDRTTNGTGEVAKMPLETIRKYVTDEGTRVPTLLQVLDEFGTSSAIIFIELKHPKAAMPTAKIVDHYIKNKGYGMHQLVIVSFFHQLLVQIHQQYPKLITGASLKAIPESLAACGEFTGSRYVLADIDVLTEEFIKDAHSKRLKVLTWPCDDKETIMRAKLLKVDGIITADPALAV